MAKESNQISIKRCMKHNFKKMRDQLMKNRDPLVKNQKEYHQRFLDQNQPLQHLLSRSIIDTLSELSFRSSTDDGGQYQHKIDTTRIPQPGQVNDQDDQYPNAQYGRRFKAHPISQQANRY